MTKQVNRLDHLIGENLHRLRVAKGLSVDDLANHLNITSQIIENYEAGRKRIAAEDLYGFSKVLEVEMIYFFTDSDEKFDRAFNSDLNKDISLTPEEEQKILFKLSEVEDTAVRNRLLEVFQQVKKTGFQSKK